MLPSQSFSMRREASPAPFSHTKTLVRVSIPDDVTKLGSNVFKSSELLVDVSLPDELTEMGGQHTF